MTTFTIKERPILFGGETIPAILDGTKTQTRRVMRVQPPTDSHYLINACRNIRDTLWAFFDSQNGHFMDYDQNCPYGKPGDRLYVRETWQYNPYGGVVYRAGSGIVDCDGRGWRPSIHMRREASRIDLEIKDVRVERVQDISEEDAIAEGLQEVYGPRPFHANIERFQWFWDTLNAKCGYGWDVNPWVWVLGFKRIKP